MRGNPGRPLPWQLGVAVLGVAAVLAVPLAAVASSEGATSVTLTSSENPAAYGDQIILTATVIPATGTSIPTGSVTFENSGYSLGTVSLGPTGQAALVDSALAAETHGIVAEYSGSDTYASSASVALEQTVTVQGSTTLLLPTVNPAPYGETLLFVAAVVADGGTGVPTGTITLMSGGSTVGTATLAGGTAAVVVSSLDAGSHTLTAAYPGDHNFSPSASGAVTETIDPASTATALTLSPTGVTAGGKVTVTAGVTSPTLDSAHAAEPGGGVLGAVADDFVSAAPEPPELVTVGAAPNSVNQGQSVTLNSVVYGLSGAPFPSGTVDFIQGAALLGTAVTTQVATTNDAIASLPIVLSAGSYPSITAEYVPNAKAAASYTSATSPSSVAVTVTRVPAPTTLAVATSLNPAPKSQPLIVTATVNHPSSSLTPTGTVSFTVKGGTPEVVALNDLGQASLTLSTLAAGTQTIAASYAGDGNFSSSSGSVTETVTGSGSPTATPTSTPQPTSTPKPTATPKPTSTLQPTSTPKPGGGPTPAAPTAIPSPSGPSTSRAAAVVIPPATTTPPSRPSGLSGSGAPNPDQFDTSAVPPIDLISLVSGIHMGNAPQIIVFLLIGNALLIAAVVIADRRGRRLTQRSLEWAGGAADQLAKDPR